MYIYLSRVAALLVHSVFFFPGLGLQAIIYLDWLLDRAGGLTAAETRRVNARARQAMALSSRELLTEQELDQFLGGSITRPWDLSQDLGKWTRTLGSLEMGE